MGTYKWNVAQSIFLEDVWEYDWVNKMGTDSVVQTLRELQQDGDRDVTHQDFWVWYRSRPRTSTASRCADTDPEVTTSPGISWTEHQSSVNRSVPTASPKAEKVEAGKVRKSSRKSVPTFKAAQKKMPTPKATKPSGPKKKAPDDSTCLDRQVRRGPGRPRKDATKASSKKRPAKGDQGSHVTTCHAPPHSDASRTAGERDTDDHGYASPASSMETQAPTDAKTRTPQRSLKSLSDTKLNLSASRVRSFIRRPRPPAALRPSDPQPADSKVITEIQNLPGSPFRQRRPSSTMVTVLSPANKTVQVHVRLCDPKNTDVDLRTGSSIADISHHKLFVSADKLSFDAEVPGNAEGSSRSALGDLNYPDNITQDGSKVVIHVKPKTESKVCQVTAGVHSTVTVQSGPNVPKGATTLRQNGPKATNCTTGVRQTVRTHSTALVKSCPTMPRFPTGVRQTRPRLGTHSSLPVQTGPNGPRFATDFRQPRRGRPRLRMPAVQVRHGASASASSHTAAILRRRRANTHLAVSVRSGSSEPLRTKTAQCASSSLRLPHVSTSRTCSLPNASAKSCQSLSTVTVSHSSSRIPVSVVTSSSSRPRVSFTSSSPGNSHSSATTTRQTHRDRRDTSSSGSSELDDIFTVDLTSSDIEFDLTDSELSACASAYNIDCHAASTRTKTWPRLSPSPDAARLSARPSSIASAISSLDGDPNQLLGQHWQRYFELCRHYRALILDRDQLMYLLSYAQINDSPNEECLLNYIKKRIAVTSQQLLNWFDFFREVVKPRLQHLQYHEFMFRASEDNHPRS